MTENKITTSSNKKVFVVSNSKDFFHKIQTILKDFPDFNYLQLNNLEQFMELDSEKENPYLFLIDGNLGQNTTQEWTQTIKMTFSNISLIVFHSSQSPLAFANLKKNGADKLIHLTFDREFIIDIILDLVPYDFNSSNIPLAALSAIKLDDLSSELEINFDVFIHLPFNHKTILYRKKGSLLEDSKIKKIDSQSQKMYFKKTDQKAFLEYARTAQTFSNSDNPLALTEKMLKSKKIIFEIMNEFFDQEVTDYKSGKIILERCKEIILEYGFTNPHTPEQAMTELLKFTGDYRTFYSDAINICAFSAYIGHIIGYTPEKIESLAIAGLLHNIGLSYVDDYTVSTDPETLPPEKKELYYTYPVKSELMIKSKKVPLSPEVSDAILDHRENSDGSGFPKKVSSGQTKESAKILRIAYELQVRTSLTDGQSKKIPKEALKDMKDIVLSANPTLDLGLVLNICKTLSIK